MTVDAKIDGSLPLYRSMHLLAVLHRFALAEGVPTARLLANNTLRPDDLEDPDYLATTWQEMAMIRELKAALDRPGLGLDVGREYHVGTLGAVGIAALHCETLADAIGLIKQYRELLGSYFALDTTEADGRLVVSMPQLIDLGDIRDFICEREFTAILRVLSDLLGSPVNVIEVRVAYGRPTNHEAYAGTLGCPVRFGMREHQIVLDQAILGARLPLASPLARRSLERDCREALVRLRERNSVEQQMLQEIVYRREGVPDLESLARRLHMSPRTFRRRLTEEGTSYRDVVARVQKSESLRLLRTSDLPMHSIAEQVGFSDVGNFYRAFRRWTGTTPGEVRSSTVEA